MLYLISVGQDRLRVHAASDSLAIQYVQERIESIKANRPELTPPSCVDIENESAQHHVATLFSRNEV